MVASGFSETSPGVGGEGGVGGVFAVRGEECVEEPCDGSAEDGVLVIGESEVVEHGLLVAAVEACHVVEDGVEVVVGDQEDAVVLLGLIVSCDVAFDHASDGGLAGAFFAEDDGGGGLVEAAEDFGVVGVHGGAVDHSIEDGVE